ncbi:Glutathione S-transferase L3 [Galdieria sulphuraria]|uniref:Glutathione S-transferase n=1 Tax=Galdieria sulphuraria TaxID=130081 RepID=M2Y2I7_GALSU|nr:glutathione S-transferase [Galdieria sulphuraria]EME30168.1 glutathione S-transferase [Galdieria sulphuraria]GJD11632.1 Glutathione S-transferase L3 [Galdieria sulphuraria]|eukprot:XP_005706688.1 glutathione S-transferase [Galdieria sulphuraria]
MELSFLYAPICPFAQRTWILLKKLKVHFKEVIIELGKDNREPWFLELNPLGKVPVLRVREAVEEKEAIIYESLVCNEYLNEVYAGNKLLPEHASQRAFARILSIRVDGLISVMFKLLKTNPEEDGQGEIELLQQVCKQLQVIDDQVKNSGGPYLFGKSWTLADIAYLPFVERVSLVLSQFFKKDIRQMGLSYFNLWLNTWDKDPDYLETKLPLDRLLPVYKKYAHEGLLKRLE